MAGATPATCIVGGNQTHQGGRPIPAGSGEGSGDPHLAVPGLFCTEQAASAPAQTPEVITSAQFTLHQPLTGRQSNIQAGTSRSQSRHQQLRKEGSNSRGQMYLPEQPAETRVPLTMTERQMLMSPVNPHVGIARDSRSRRPPQEHPGRQSPGTTDSRPDMNLAPGARMSHRPPDSTQHLSSQDGSQSERASFTRIDSME